MKGRTYRYMTDAPLFPFGFGLSYTTFNIGDATGRQDRHRQKRRCASTVPVTNTGSRDGVEILPGLPPQAGRCRCAAPFAPCLPARTAPCRRHSTCRRGVAAVGIRMFRHRHQHHARHTGTVHPVLWHQFRRPRPEEDGYHNYRQNTMNKNYYYRP